MNRVHVQRLTHSWCIFVILTHARNDEKISEKIEKFENKWCVTEKLQQMYNSESAGEKKVLKDLFGCCRCCCRFCGSHILILNGTFTKPAVKMLKTVIN